MTIFWITLIIVVIILILKFTGKWKRGCGLKCSPSKPTLPQKLKTHKERLEEIKKKIEETKKEKEEKNGKN